MYESYFHLTDTSGKQKILARENHFIILVLKF